MTLSPSVTRASSSVFLLLVSGFWILASLPAPAIVDTNNNGVSDIWEKHYNNGNLIANLDPQADSDRDGWTNIQEAAAGTNPFDPNPPDGFIRPDIVHIPATYSSGTNGDPGILTPETITLTWPTLTGKQYTLHYSPDLSEGSWQPVEAPYIGNGNSTQYGIPLTQPDGSTPDKLFWRVAVGDIDTDGDSLSNYEESILGTNSNNRDTDLDGIADNLDITPLANNAITDPDGDNLPASLATGLTGRWDLETITTANGVRASPNTANPSIPAYLGGAIEADNNGMVSKSVRMSAMNQYIKTDPSIITGKASFSISFWFRFEKNYLQNKPGTFHTVLFAFNDVIDSTPLFQLHAYKALSTLGTQKLIFSHYDNNLNYPDIIGEIPLSAPLDEGNWQHLTLTKSSGTIRIYRNSQQLVSGSGLSGVLQSTANGYLCFGALVPTTLGVDTNFRGSMDRLRTWSRAISQSEVSALYHQDIDRDGLWDITENNTRYSNYSNSVIIHPDPANPTAPQPTQTGYARSPFLHSSGALDFDQDELNDLAEQTAGTNLTKPDTDDDNLTDGFEISNNFNPLNAYSLGATGPRDDLSDPDSDTLNTLTEYLNSSNPRSLNSDGDAKNDDAEIAQGSDPANAADSGAAPTDPPEPVPFHINGDYTAWEATLKGKGPNDTRTRRFRMSAHNVAADKTLNLLRGNAYELSLRYIRTKPGETVPWYCWEATIAGNNTPAFTVADHWLVDNSSALLATHTHSHGTNLVADKKVNLLPIDIEEVISDQIAGNEANKLPTAYFGGNPAKPGNGHPNNPMLMATRSGSDARLMIKMNVPAAQAASIRVGVRQTGQTTILNSVASVPPPGMTPLSFTALSGSTPTKLYEVVAGYDANSNAVLENSEVAVVFEKTPRKDREGNTATTNLHLLDKFIVVTLDDFTAARAVTDGYGTGTTINTFFPTAAKMIAGFARGATTITGSSPPESGVLLDASTIPSLEGLSHPLGGKWNAAKQTITHRLVLPTGSDLSEDVVGSTGLRDMYVRALWNYRATIAAGATTSWGVVKITFIDKDIDFSASDTNDQVHAALGKCNFVGSLEVSCKLKAGGGFDVGALNCYGAMVDLYDFAFGASKVTVLGIDIADPKEAARTQAGFATLTFSPWPDAGRVFFTKVELGTGWFDYTGSYPP